MYYFKRSFLFDIWQAEGNVIRGCWGRCIAGLPPCLSYSDGFPPVGDLLNLALIWTRMRISDPLMEKVEKFVCTKFLFCSLKKFLNKVQCNPLSQPLLSIFIWNLKVCFPPPLPCWFLFDQITSVAKGRNVPCSRNEAPVTLQNEDAALHTSSALAVTALSQDASIPFTLFIMKVLMQFWLTSWWGAAFFKL